MQDFRVRNRKCLQIDDSVCGRNFWNEFLETTSKKASKQLKPHRQGLGHSQSREHIRVKEDDKRRCMSNVMETLFTLRHSSFDFSNRYWMLECCEQGKFKNEGRWWKHTKESDYNQHQSDVKRLRKISISLNAEWCAAIFETISRRSRSAFARNLRYFLPHKSRCNHLLHYTNIINNFEKKSIKQNLQRNRKSFSFCSLCDAVRRVLVVIHHNSLVRSKVYRVWFLCILHLCCGSNCLCFSLSSLL